MRQKAYELVCHGAHLPSPQVEILRLSDDRAGQDLSYDFIAFTSKETKLLNPIMSYLYYADFV